MKISIIHPSRSRANKAYATTRNWILNANEKVEYIMSVDSDDPELLGYQNFGLPHLVSNNSNAVQAANIGAKEAKGDIIVCISDDFVCFKDWDLAIIDAMKGKSGVLKTFDGVQKWICTLPIVTRDYYQEQGFIYDPSFGHMFCDTQLTHIADLKKKLIIRNDIVFKHDHYSVTKTAKDEVTKKADSTWDSGKRTYLRNCKNKFGLGIDIFNLSPEAHQAGHVAWLKKELRHFR